MIGVEDWAEIRRLHLAERRSIKLIARELELARNTVRAAIRSSEPPRYERQRSRSIVDAVEDEIRRWLAEWPTMPATVIAERIGWTHGMTVLRQRVRELRPVYQPPAPYQRTEYTPGEIGQWDIWFPPVAIPVLAWLRRNARADPRWQVLPPRHFCSSRHPEDGSSNATASGRAQNRRVEVEIRPDREVLQSE